MNILLNTFWFFRTTKYVLFWIYLWQIKEYHIPRFLDHFNTDKGRKLLINPSAAAKILILLLLAFASDLFSVCFVAVFAIYAAECVIFARQIFNKSFKKPVKTSKTILLTLISFTVVLVFLFFISANLSDREQVFWLLAFDVLLPVIISAIVLFLQPFFVVIRNNILKKASKKIAEHKNLKVVAITGSYGKTSTKEFLATILKAKYNVLRTKEHQNSEMGIAKCILEDLKPEHEIFVVEMGSYKKGGIKLLCDIVKPQIGIVTGVNEQHLALFGSLENLLSAEGGRELADELPENGILILNSDNKYCLDLYKKTQKPKKTYSLNRAKFNSDIWAEDIVISKESASFTALDGGNEVMSYKVNVLGRQNVQNLLGAMLAARELGMDFGRIAEGCINIKPEQSGMLVKKNHLGICVLDSSYSANPDGVVADLEYLNIWKGRKIIVMPCLIELGKKSAEIHKKLGQKIGKICDVAIITTKENFGNIKEGAIYAGMKEKDIVFCDNPEDIYSIITLRAAAGDAVLLEGRVPQKLVDMISK